ncbi:D-threitol dehydrogenase-like [Rana temporaria]|uniref:D-threitol dehydrogenase-like n=1 Tax=Rana temporaria TaxID=8407 RepID=UPI001AAC4847|nr:D-threitol dehydrogenase-like [Rana temporaria]
METFQGVKLWKADCESTMEHKEKQVYTMLVQLTRPRKILQLCSLSTESIGMLCDYLPDDGCLVTSDICPAKEKKIQKRKGTKEEILKELAALGEQYDMVFIDATEENPINYYNLIMSGNMLRMNGVICVQNASTSSQEGIDDETGFMSKEMTDVIKADARVEQVKLPSNCGIFIGRRISLSQTSHPLKGIVEDDVFRGFGGHGILDRLRLDGKVAYVTGGGQGIGRAFGHALGEAGAKVAIVDMDLEKAEAVAHELHLKGINSVAMAADISKEEDVKRVVDAIVANWGRIDIACNNAGINMNSASEDTTLEEWDKTFNVNLRGLFICCQAAGRVMLSQGYGKIINTASMASLIVPHPQKQLAYNTSKAGVVKLTQTLGTEWIDRGVRVNCISPGIVDTPLIHSEALKPLVKRWLADIPAGRLAQVTDLQAAVVYLASEASDYMTGHNLVIDGGQSLW